jgi:hypothetical protein
VLRWCVVHHASNVQLCIFDGTPGGWRPDPQATHIVAVHKDCVELAQDAVMLPMNARRTFVRLDAVLYVSIPTAALEGDGQASVQDH